MDIKHFYQEKGEGDCMILLHGNGEDHTYFEGQIEDFSKHFHVYALDTRGHGKTLRGEAPFTIRQFAKDLKSFMDEHQIEKANLLGFSDGGNIALVFALKYPYMVDRLILNGTNLNPRGVKKRTQIPIEIVYRIAKRFEKNSDKAKANAEMLGLMVHDPNINIEELAKLKAKTLVIAGDNDMIKEEHTRSIAKKIPGAKLCILKGNHFVANKEPEAFNKVVLEFLLDKS